MINRFLTASCILAAAAVALLATPAEAKAARSILNATPAADEGDDGVLEGEGEGVNTPAPSEGDDGEFEGMGEGTATPAADEGDDGELEGLGEGAGNSTVEGEASGAALLTLSSLAAASAAAAALLAL